ncbi:MAG: S-methyl-5'-thioadenosine phosphorylase [bacterium]
MAKDIIGVIGGSGLYDIEGLSDVSLVKVDTPFGEPSDKYIRGTLEGREVVFLPRHGIGHRILPSELNFRANIYGFKLLGVSRILSVSAVGSMKKELKPMDMVVIDQFFDRTNMARKNSFFGEGIVGHVSFADPVCGDLSETVYQAGQKTGSSITKGGTYICIEGPQFSTRAESNIFRSWGVDVIGMTNVTEARLAREAEICYATLAMVTDYDCWHEGEEDVTVEAVMAIMKKNAQTARKIISRTIAELPENRRCGCGEMMACAIVTDRSVIPPETRKNLEVVLGKYLVTTI